MDNYFKDCPPKMDDGRYLTDFRPTSIREQFIKSINGIVRDDEYRNFLQKNGESIIDREWSALRKTQSCHTNQSCTTNNCGHHKKPNTGQHC